MKPADTIVRFISLLRPELDGVVVRALPSTANHDFVRIEIGAAINRALKKLNDELQKELLRRDDPLR